MLEPPSLNVLVCNGGLRQPWLFSGPGESGTIFLTVTLGLLKQLIEGALINLGVEAVTRSDGFEKRMAFCCSLMPDRNCDVLAYRYETRIYYVMALSDRVMVHVLVPHVHTGTGFFGAEPLHGLCTDNIPVISAIIVPQS